MVFPPILAQKIKAHIKNLLDSDVVIYNNQGQIITSEISFGVETSIIKELPITTNDTIEVENRRLLIIPLLIESTPYGRIVVNDDEPKARTYAPIITSLAELMIGQYLERNKPVLDATDVFVSKLISSKSSEINEYESEIRVLGYSVNSPRIALVVHLADFWTNCLSCDDQSSFERVDVIKDWKRNIELKLGSFFTQTTDNIIAYVGNDTFVVFKSLRGTNEDAVMQMLKKSYRSIFEPLKNITISRVTVGVSNLHAGIDGLLVSYREGAMALDYGRLMWGDNQSHHYRDLGILSILGEGNHQKQLEYARRQLHKLKNPDLLETIESFFQSNLNLTDTATIMGVHRNTIIYRLNRVTELLGNDPRNFEQAMAIKMALLIRKLLERDRESVNLS